MYRLFRNVLRCALSPRLVLHLVEASQKEKWKNINGITLFEVLHPYRGVLRYRSDILNLRKDFG